MTMIGRPDSGFDLARGGRAGDDELALGHGRDTGGGDESKDAIGGRLVDNGGHARIVEAVEKRDCS